MLELKAIDIQLPGFNENESVRIFAEAVRYEVLQISKAMDLSSLDGITIPYDYQSETSSFDRGFPGFRPLAISNDEFIGVGITTEVMRAGLAKSHIIFHPDFIVTILSGDATERAEAEYIIAHECAHVEANSWFRRAFPYDDLDGNYPTAELISRWSVINACWDEYAACRLSARFGPQEISRRLADFRQSLANMHSLIKHDLSQANESDGLIYLQNTMFIRCGNLMKMASYMLGHLDGLNDEPTLQKIRDEVKNTFFDGFLNRLSVALRAVWNERGNWASKEVFLEIGDIALDLIRNRGVEIKPLENGAFVRLVDFSIYTDS